MSAEVQSSAARCDTTRVGVAQFAHGGGGVALYGPDSKVAAVLYLKVGAASASSTRRGG